MTSSKPVFWAVTLSAAVLFAASLCLLFAPDESVRALFPDQGGIGGSPILASLLGACLFGFASMNWIARHSLLGGIYGRAVVVGNQAHFFIGTLLLTRYLYPATSPALWALFGLYLFGAVLFSYLLFRKTV